MRRMHLPRPVKETGPVEYRPWEPSFWTMLLSSAVLLGVVVGLLLSVFWQTGPVAGEEFHLWKWQANTFTSTAFARVGIGPNPDDTAGDAAVQRYFAITSRIRAESEMDAPDLAVLELLENERATYENDVERLIQRRLGEVIEENGYLQRRLPLFQSVKITWPPVEFELTSPPRLLVRSPRDRIERTGDTLLKTDLSLRQIERIEAATDNADRVSLVISIGGLAAYPAIVRDDRSYYAVLETAAHEWVHHYLAFYPLGRQWGKGGDAEALNETTANIAGRELAYLVRQLYPIEFPDDLDGRAPARPPSDVDFNSEMRSLRLQVDALLDDGDVAGAERLMEEKRLWFNANGIPIRKLNQAYFAFYGTYADGPASSNPIGPKIERVWELTGDVGIFLVLMREVRNADDLDELLVGLEAARESSGHER